MLAEAMPKPKKTPSGKPKTPKPRAREIGEVVLVSVEVRPELLKLAEQHQQKAGSTRKFMFNRGLELFLESVGLWPPKEAE